MKPFELSDIVIKVRDARDMSDTTEEKMFEAYLGKSRIAYIMVDRTLKPTDKELEDKSVMDYSFIPPKPKPNLSFILVIEDCKGHNITERLIDHANEYYKTKHGIPLHSGIINIPGEARFWERLAEKGKAREYYHDDRRFYTLL